MIKYVKQYYRCCIMNKLFYIFIFTCGCYLQNFAQSQLTNLQKVDAIKAVKYLETQKEVILYSGCEINDIARKISLEKVWYETSQDDANRFNVKITGKITATFSINKQETINYQKKSVPESKNNLLIDLSTVHVATGGYTNNEGKYIWDATCLGIYLGYSCDPCIDPFDYPEEANSGGR